MADLGIALLGLGRAGAFHVESIRSLAGVRLRRVYDVDPGKAKELTEQSGCEVASAADEAISAAGVDAVVVATPTLTHHGYVMAALRAGKAVLCEKPLGTTLDEIDGCFALARSQGVPLLVAFQRRFDPSFAAIIGAARAGEAGELHYIRSVSRDNPVPSIDYIRSSCGIFHDCVVHDLDMICQIAGERPEEVFALGSSFIAEIAAVGDLDNVLVSLRFASGLLASIDVSRKSAFGYDQRLEVFGSAGMLQLENRPRTLLVRATEKGLARPPVDHSFPTRYRDAYRAEFETFLECVRGTREVPITREQVRLNHLLADAAERSHREKCAIRLD